MSIDSRFSPVPVDTECREDGLEDDICCPNCGSEVTEFPDELLAEIKERIDMKKKRLAELREEEIQIKKCWCDLVETKQRLAVQWNKVLLARSRINLFRKGCDLQDQQNQREWEELQVLEKTNQRRSERLKHVGRKDFVKKERVLMMGVGEETRRVQDKLSELVAVRQQFISSLYLRVFPIEVLPLSDADAGEDDYYEHVKIDCDRVLDLDEGWVLGGIHCHPTPHISIVTPSLPANGDHTHYLYALAERAKHKGVEQDSSALHPVNDSYLSVPAALSYVAHFVELIALVLDQPLPFPLLRPVAISEYGNPVKRRRAFLESVAKLDDNIIYLCFSQNVPSTCLAVGHSLQNLLALVTHSQLGRTGAFECHPELISYKGGGARRVIPTRDSDDSQPPNVSYSADISAFESEEEAEEEEGLIDGDESSHAAAAAGEGMNWEHLEPSLEDLRLFEEEQMRHALNSSSESCDLVQRHAQEVEIYRQRLRRLEHNTTYKDYAAVITKGVSSASLDSAHASGVKLIGEADGKAQQEAPPPANPQPPAGIFGTLSSLWTSTFGGQ